MSIDSRIERIYDKRVVERNILTKKLSKEEFASYLGELPDLSDACDDVAELAFGSVDNTVTSEDTNKEL